MTGIAGFSLMGKAFVAPFTRLSGCNCLIPGYPFLIGKMNLIEYLVVY